MQRAMNRARRPAQRGDALALCLHADLAQIGIGWRGEGHHGACLGHPAAIVKTAAPPSEWPARMLGATMVERSWAAAIARSSTTKPRVALASFSPA